MFEQAVVLECFLPYLVNSDATGLNEQGLQQVDTYLNGYRYVNHIDSPFYAKCEITGLRGMCVEIELVED